MTPELEQKIAKLPKVPGVYIMKGADGKIFYIGKATELRTRVKQYFQGTDPRPFVKLLDRILDDVDFIVTRTPLEALLLENTLIKRHRPRYNYMLRDDKSYASLRIDPRVPWPRVDLVRNPKNDGARYFGPWAHASTARTLLPLINKHFQIRNCSDSVFKNRARPCLQYQIKRCPGPCVLPVDPDAYADNVRHVMLFLSGRSDELVTTLEERMMRCAERMEYEVAAQLRDQIQAIRESHELKSAGLFQRVDTHVIGVHREGSSGMIALTSFEHGKMSDMEVFPVQRQFIESPDLISEFILQYYDESLRKPPELILLSEELRELPEIRSALSQFRGSPVTMETPKRGEKRAMVELSLQNAAIHFEHSGEREERVQDALEALQKIARLRQVPRTMECFDISNFQGEEVVASQVSFMDGVPDKARYRRYRMRTVEGQDDFQSMYEVISRRAKRAQTGDDPLPDLLVIDGGSGQLKSACAALSSHGIVDQDIISLAEARVIGVDDSDAAVHSAERIYLPNVRDPIPLARHNDTRLVLERIRDEAHRFALAFHRERRNKKRLVSALDEIRGIGPQRKQDLMTHFGSVRAIKAASLQELEQAPGFGRKAAWAVYDHFHPGETDAPE